MNQPKEKKAEVMKEITPSTMAKELKVSKKLTYYEVALEEMEKLEKEQDDVEDKLKKVCREGANQSGFSNCLKEYDFKVYKPSKFDPETVEKVMELGSYLPNLVSSEKSDLFKKIVGEKAFEELYKVSQLYATRAVHFKEVDDEKSKERWEEYSKLLSEWEGLKKKLRYAQAKVTRADKFATYANSLADIARKTKDMA